VNNLPSPAASTGTSGAGATSGAQGRATTPIRSVGGNSNPAATRRSESNVGSGIGRAPASVKSDFDQRVGGGTAGTTSRGGQAVFGSSAPARATSKHHAAAPAATSPRSATGDLWSGFKPSARSSVLAAASSAKPSGIGATATAALAALGLGLAGIAGAMAFVMLRSRRTKSRSGAGGSGTTKM